jgi:hypothetical protein
MVLTFEGLDKNKSRGSLSVAKSVTDWLATNDRALQHRRRHSSVRASAVDQVGSQGGNEVCDVLKNSFAIGECAGTEQEHLSAGV